MKRSEKIPRAAKTKKSDETGSQVGPDQYNSINEDPLNKKASSEFQQGNWQSCADLIQELSTKYPDDPTLAHFKTEFEFQYSVLKNIEKSAIDKKRSVQKKNLKELLLLIGAAVIVVLVVVAIFVFFSANTSQTQQVLQSNQIAAYADQVESLLRSGQPDKAAEVIQLMQKINAANPTVVALAAKTDETLKLQRQYEDAMADISAGKYAEALKLLQSIDLESPNYRDVSHLIETVQTTMKVSKLTLDGRTAFEKNDWQTTIDALEFVQMYGGDVFTDELKTMLLNSYLHRIIQMLGNNSTTYEQIDQAESYYRRAIAMIPQSKMYADQRADLEKISSDLLILSFTQSAYQITQNPDQNLAMVNQALSYIKKAANLDPTNTSITSELNKLILYQAGYQYFLGMNWSQAIDQLSSLFTMDENYANGFARQLLYEAYFSRGEQLVNAGYFADARKQFELAEMLTWNEPNLVNFYLIEVKLGETLAKMGDYQDAAAYYKYAIETVDYSQRAASHSEFVANLISAENLYANAQFEQAVNLFQSTLKDQDYFFTTTEVSVQKGDTLALIAARYLSSVSIIVDKNGLPDQPTLLENRTLLIPGIPK
jgi:tetratricopeptide (TPR) repeat protein